MRKINYVEDLRAFWETRRKSRNAVDRNLSRLSFTEKLVIADKMRANHIAMRDAKRVTKASPKPSKT